jgi:hypothetical protein
MGRSLGVTVLGAGSEEARAEVMPKFRATVRFVDLVGPDVMDVRQALENRLRDTGIETAWRVVDVTPVKVGLGSEPSVAMRSRIDRSIAGLLTLVAVGALGLWFFFSIFAR